LSSEESGAIDFKRFGAGSAGGFTVEQCTVGGGLLNRTYEFTNADATARPIAGSGAFSISEGTLTSSLSWSVSASFLLETSQSQILKLAP
jgi:hypothetical protein